MLQPGISLVSSMSSSLQPSQSVLGPIHFPLPYESSALISSSESSSNFQGRFLLASHSPSSDESGADIDFTVPDTKIGSLSEGIVHVRPIFNPTKSNQANIISNSVEGPVAGI